MADPTRKEVESIRKRIDTVNRQLKPLGKSCVKKRNTGFTGDRSEGNSRSISGPAHVTPVPSPPLSLSFPSLFSLSRSLPFWNSLSL